jgi:peroxiredoxin Q/BCP
MTVEVGEPVPDFSLPSDTGGLVGPADYRGRKLVLYFYPRDDTPGCTTEALDFTAKLPEFEAAGVAVIAISKDSVKSHARFRDKHDLAVTLLSDEIGTVVERFGLWGEKTLYGRRFMGVERATFLVDADGIVRRVWPKVKVAGHADEVLAAAKAL